MPVQKVRKDGRDRWRARIRVGDKLLTAFRDTRGEAIEAERALRERVKAAAAEPAGETPQRKEAPTLAAMWTDFAEFQASKGNKRPWRPRTAATAADAFRLWIAPWLGETPVDRITAERVDRLAADLQAGRRPDGKRKRRLSDATVANVLQLVVRMLRVAKRWGHAVTIPDVDTSKERPSCNRIEDDEWLTAQEVAALVEHADGRWSAVILVACRSGLRRGELQALRWRDVDLVGRRLHVHRSWDDRMDAFGPPKSGKPRDVPIAWDAIAALETLERGKPDALVFGQDGRPFHRNAYDRALRRAAKRAEVAKHVHPHTTRHTWTSHAILAGVPSKVVQRWGGWGSEAMLDRYSHLVPAEVDHFADRLAPGGPLRVVRGVTAGVTEDEKTRSASAERVPRSSGDRI